MRPIILALLLLLFADAFASACIHTPANYHMAVTEKTKEALLFHDGKYAHLIVKTNLDAGGHALPPFMAWVIPLPALPVHYEEADPKLFEELFNVVEDEERRQYELARLKGEPEAASTSTASVRVHPLQIVGNYQIQPIEILSETNAGAELNRWLIQNGFRPVPVENQRYYLHKGAVFLALKLLHLNGPSTDIKPLHIVYPSDHLTLPLKFSTHSGVFDVMLYTFTAQPIDPAIFTNCALGQDGPSVQISTIGQAPRLAKLTGNRRGYLTRFIGNHYNGEGGLVRDLPADPTIDVDQAHAAAWEGSLIPAWRKPLIGILIFVAVCSLLVWMVGKRRTLRESAA